MSPVTGTEQKAIGHYIAELRERARMTQGDLAGALKTTQSAVARIEAGKQNVSAGMLLKISRALGRDIVTLSSGALNFKIEGGRKLKGTVATNSSKNSAVGLLCAVLVNRGRTELRGMPRIEEGNRVIEVLTSIGVSARWLNDTDLEIIPPKRFALEKLNVASAVKTRSILMLLGPLVHELRSFKIPYPGGCKLGLRTVRPHLFALEKLGVSIKATKGNYHVSVKKLAPADIVLYEAGDTVTENALMAAARIPGKTTISFASANYMVQDVARFLTTLGVKIDGIGTTTMTVHGKRDINLSAVFYPSEDPIESMLFLSLAATTNSSITIERCPIDFLALELLKLEKMGFKYRILRRYKSKNGYTNLVDVKTLPSPLHALEEKLHAQPYPGLNIDNLPFFVPIAARAKGTTLIHDWVYENRAIYYLELAKLNVRIILADPHRVYVEGPADFRAAEVICPPALRPAVIILIAMLAAPGVSVLRNVYSINRGYSDLVNRLRKLGARIEILHGV